MTSPTRMTPVLLLLLVVVTAAWFAVVWLTFRFATGLAFRLVAEEIAQRLAGDRVGGVNFARFRIDAVSDIALRGRLAELTDRLAAISQFAGDGIDAVTIIAVGSGMSGIDIGRLSR